ncbi:hypothetical protein N7517_008943 [Penicillium concentricum]|uniref:Uncharacterized protein n=1 Tax=Penicillium concentricum TaxID=293559 RepID=A0A9W9V254_9EURO|nr:uncharacterized protein N7517_008943 [Penicillium concentricum]KAJ5366057.1 hypothetical protein N7517_008943 [Penicillium concentricum]
MSGWQQIFHYPDHLGHRVVLEEFVKPEFPDPSHLVSIQVNTITGVKFLTASSNASWGLLINFL